ncbi:MAG: class I SAM-dependent methyltransferase [Desulfovibrio sp.]|nr:MAG: class I SAM-dependent methyltransferase [Desulfovibrio sp.]
MHPNRDLWQATYEARDQEELVEAYSRWAEDYDKDTVETMGYVAPLHAAKALDARLGSKQARILDAGAGTGLVGEMLNQAGYHNIDALDISREMLDIAATKQVYQNLIQADMSQTLDVDDNAYDAVVCVGTFTYGHVRAEAFNELVRITNPEGFICFTVREGAYEAYDYRKHMVRLEAQEVWELLEMTREDYLVKEKVQSLLCSYKVLEC